MGAQGPAFFSCFGTSLTSGRPRLRPTRARPRVFGPRRGRLRRWFDGFFIDRSDNKLRRSVEVSTRGGTFLRFRAGPPGGA
eukprot:2649766-Pyramimonas_sp.AAC.1